MIRGWKGKHPRVHPLAFVSEAAYVVGDVELGENSSVWPGTVVRGDSGKITIGRNTGIQDGSIVHSDADAWIGDNVTIGHGVVCHARRIADNCLIANGAILNDGVEVGEWSLVASGAVVLDDTKVPPYSFVVGVPAQVKGRVSERHMERIRATAAHYVERCRQYKGEGLE